MHNNLSHRVRKHQAGGPLLRLSGSGVELVSKRGNASAAGVQGQFMTNVCNIYIPQNRIMYHCCCWVEVGMEGEEGASVRVLSVCMCEVMLRILV
jgi:hypothetical protein